MRHLIVTTLPGPVKTCGESSSSPIASYCSNHVCSNHVLRNRVPVRLWKKAAICQRFPTALGIVRVGSRNVYFERPRFPTIPRQFRIFGPPLSGGYKSRRLCPIHFISVFGFPISPVRKCCRMPFPCYSNSLSRRSDPELVTSLCIPFPGMRRL